MTPSAATVLDGLDAVRAAVGRHLGHSSWVEVDPVRVDRFAEAVGGRPLSDPYLVLSLSNLLLPQVVEVRGVAMGVNYGVDRVRFAVAVRPGGRLRAGVELLAVTEVPGGVCRPSCGSPWSWPAARTRPVRSTPSVAG